MMVEISPQHHNIVLGRNNENLKGIKQRTNTQIVFQDANDPNIPSLKKSNVIITGSINNVYIARQQLIVSFFYIYFNGCLLLQFLSFILRGELSLFSYMLIRRLIPTPQHRRTSVVFAYSATAIFNVKLITVTTI